MIAAALALGPAVALSAETFTYDALGRLKTARSESGATREYHYDAADNILQVVLGSGPTTPPPTSTVTWERAGAASEWTFADSDRTAIFDGWGGFIAATTGRATGEYEFSVTVQNPQTTQVGLSRRKADPNNLGLGANPDTIGMRHDGNVYGPGGWDVLATLGAPAHGDVITVRLKDGRVWFRRNAGPWNGAAAANPATNFGGLTAPALSSTFPSLYPAVYAGGDGPGGAPAVRYTADFTNWANPIGGQPPAGSGAIWNRTPADPGWTISADGKVATYDDWGSMLTATTGKTGSEEGRFSVTILNPNTSHVGLARVQADPNDLGVGANADSIGMRHDGNVYGAGGWTVLASLGAPVSGDVVTVHLKNGQAWFRKNGGPWNPGSGVANPDPATGVGGLSTPTLSASTPRLFPAVYAGGNGPGGATVQYTGDFTAW